MGLRQAEEPRHHETASLGRAPGEPIRAPHPSFSVIAEAPPCNTGALAGADRSSRDENISGTRAPNVEVPARSRCCILVRAAGLGVLRPAQWLFEDTERVELPLWDSKRMREASAPDSARYMPVTLLQIV